MSYIAFMGLVRRAGFVLTGSGGLQEETTYLSIPCLTLRANTERPITLMQGTNRLIDIDTLEPAVDEILGGRWRNGRKPDLWDGRTAARVVSDLALRAGRMTETV